MKIVNIKGGLGNQMFQYAFACKLKKVRPEECILFDLKDYKGYKLNKYELKSVFSIDLKTPSFVQLISMTSPFSSNKLYGKVFRKLFKTLGLRKKEIVEKGHFYYHPDLLQIKGDAYYDGYWSNVKYFEDIRDQLLMDFSFRKKIGEKALLTLNQIKSTNSVGLHVRRGDYLLFDIYKGICNIDYYKKAIDYIKKHVENPYFYVFSNDLAWCKENLSPYLEKYTLVDGNTGPDNYIDMQLMMNCKHNIIANSTFSWWGAWLNQNENKIVVSPEKWLNDENVGRIQPEEWVLIK